MAAAGETDLHSPIFQIFDPIAIEKCITGSHQGYVTAKSSLTNAPYIFEIPAVGKSFLQFNSLRLWGELRVVRDDGNNLEENEEVSTSNNFANSLFSSVQLLLDNVDVTVRNASGTAYKTMLEILLSTDYTSRESYLRLLGYTAARPSETMLALGAAAVAAAAEEEEEEEEEEDDDDANPAPPAQPRQPAQQPARRQDFNEMGIKQRRTYIAESRRFQFYIPLPTDLTRSDKVLPPNHSLTVVLHRNPDSFSLLKPDVNARNYKIIIDDLRLYFNRVDLNPRFEAGYFAKLRTSPISFPVTHTEFKVFHMPRNVNAYRIQAFTGLLPKMTIMVLVNTYALTGNIQRNPYYFVHARLTSVEAEIDGRVIPAGGYKCDFPNRQYAHLFGALFDTGSKYGFNCGNEIDYNSFGAGRTIMLFDFTPDKCQMKDSHRNAEGSLCFNLQFGVAVPMPVSIVTINYFDANLVAYNDDTFKWLLY